MIVCRSREEIDKIDSSCRLVRTILGELEALVRPGVTTRTLDEYAEKRARDEGASPAFKGYYEYPASLCVSVNEEVVHGIPGERALEEGNISIDPWFTEPTEPDVHLRRGSPCIDTGLDLGEPFAGLAPDMGAVEYDTSTRP